MSIPHINDILRANEADRCVREYTLQTLKVDDLEYQRRRLIREFSESRCLTDSRKMHIEKIIRSLDAQIAWHKKRAKHWALCANLNSPIGQPAVII